MPQNFLFHRSWTCNREWQVPLLLEGGDICCNLLPWLVGNFGNHKCLFVRGLLKFSGRIRPALGQPLKDVWLLNKCLVMTRVPCWGDSSFNTYSTGGRSRLVHHVLCHYNLQDLPFLVTMVNAVKLTPAAEGKSALSSATSAVSLLQQAETRGYEFANNNSAILWGVPAQPSNLSDPTPTFWASGGGFQASQPQGSNPPSVGVVVIDLEKDIYRRKLRRLQFARQ